MNVASIRSHRLDLVSMSPAFIEALLAGDRAQAEAVGGFPLPPGWPAPADERLLRLRLEQMRQDPSTQPWLLRAMVRRRPRRQMIGFINFHGLPRDGLAELGYTVLPPSRRRGYASETIQGLMDWARTEHGVRCFRVSIAPDNAPSLALAAGLGFRQTGCQMDEEDGPELVFELELE
ncbi:MAG: GNAT family N-acetyltransferase [Chloroflexi bacterium]|nr:GNAT family N-acetyltransferase [Chloroflexota bacterium]